MAISEDMAAAVVDPAGVAVITGGASGIGLATATTLVRCGMAVAILDVSAEELSAATSELRKGAPSGAQQVLSVSCNVTSFESCEAAQREVAATFPDKRVAFLFCNAGISGRGGFSVIEGSIDAWDPIFAVNVKGVVNTIKAFVPDILAKGPLPSGKNVAVVGTSSVVGLVNHNIGPYAISKMACTAVMEQFSLELEAMGSRASHISPHLLCPSPVSTNFFNARGADGAKSARSDKFRKGLEDIGILMAEGVAYGLFRGMADGRFYIILDNELDLPTAEQVAVRMEDQMLGRRPLKPHQVGTFLKPKDLEQRRELLAQRKAAAVAGPQRDVAQSRL